MADRVATDGRVGPTDKMVPSEPFIGWLLKTRREGWTARLTDSQMRYIERILHRRPRTINVHTVDEILVRLDQPWRLNLLYPS